MNQWVLITGASQGIGCELAEVFAENGWHIVLVARDEARLQEVANRLASQHGATTKIITKDLSVPGAAREIFDELQRVRIDVSILVNNAGFGAQGAFAAVESKTHVDLIQVNISALVELTHLFLPSMLARREGRIMNVASIAAFLPGPFMAAYYASKAFVLSFSQALAEEVSGTGVTVTALCPGVTESKFHTRAGLSRQNKFVTMSSEEVARIGYRALLAGQRVVVSGWVNKWMVACMTVIPARWLAAVSATKNRPPAS